MDEEDKKKFFGPSLDSLEDFPSEMRRQMWPLCCGWAILSGLKEVQLLTPDELDQQIMSTINDYIPDFQIFAGEVICPGTTWLTLNHDQMQSPKIMQAIERAGFVHVGTGKPRGLPQGMYIRDTTNTWKPAKVS